MTTKTKPLINKFSMNGYLGLLAITLGLCIAFAFLTFKYSDQKTNFEDAATFGTGTTTLMATVDGHRIHCSDSRDAQECITGAKERRAVNSVLWLGNSQIHAVNQLKAGENSSTSILFERLRHTNLDLVSFSQPNANLQEHLVLFEYLKHQLPIKVLILPLVFDDTREDGLRKEVADFLKDSQVILELSKTPIGLKIQSANKLLNSTDKEDTAGISYTLQEKVERLLNTWLADASLLWAARSEIRGQIMLYIFTLRNNIFGIKPTSKRKIIRGRYQDNIAALEAILASAKDAKIAVALYVVPLRKDVEIPYVTAEYSQYKADAQSLANKYQASFFNLENLVPSELWGAKDSTSGEVGQELDFMHFQSGGHQLLAVELSGLVPSVLAKHWNKQ